MDFLKRKIAVSFFYVLVLFVAACSGPGGDGSSEAPVTDKIILGGILPLTGPATEYGLPAQRGSEIAVAEINDAGGINGLPLEVIWEDGQCSKEASSQAAERLVGNVNVNVILGGVCSDETIAIAPIAENAKKILITSGSSATSISNLGDYIFRNYPSNAAQAEIMARFVLGQRERSPNSEDVKVGLIVQDTEYAQDLAESFLTFFETPEGISSYNVYQSSETYFSNIVNQVKESGASMVIVLPQTSDKGIMILEELEKQQVDALILSSEVLAQRELLRDNPDILEGVFVVSVPDPFNNPKVVELSEKYSQKYGEEIGWAHIASASYDTVYMLRDAFVSCNGAQDTACVKDYLYSIQDYDGIFSGISMDPNGDVLGHEYVVHVMLRGEIRELPSDLLGIPS